MARRSNRNKNRKKRLLILIAILAIAYIILWIVTPSVEEYYGDGGQSGTVAGMEIPLLEEGDVLTFHTGFALMYDEDHEQARWVAYELTRDEVYGIHERKDNFRSDPSIKSGSAELDDYRGSGYDRGHLVPAADLPWSEESMGDSFYMSNMSPQDPSFNRGIWADLEATIRTFAATEGSIYVVTGPVLTDGPYDSIGDNNVSIPNAYYKVVLDYVEPEKKAIGFILSNEGSDRRLQRFATSIDDVEELTEIDFFPQLPDDEEKRLESSYDVDAWNFDQFMASKEEREAYSRGSTAVEIPKREDTTVTMVKSVIEKIMVQTKRELRSIIRSFDIPILDNLL
jgi:endonuclease G